MASIVRTDAMCRTAAAVCFLLWTPTTAWATSTAHTTTHTFTGGELGCGGIEIHNESPSPKHIASTFALQDSGTPHKVEVVLQAHSSYSTAVRSLAKACLLETEIHLLDSKETDIAQTGEIGPPPYIHPDTKKLLEGWVAHDERARQEEEDAANERAWKYSLASAGLTEAERRQVIQQAERDFQALQHTWNDATAAQRLRALRQAHPSCRINGPEDVAPCLVSELRAKREAEDQARAAQAKARELQQQADAAAFVVAQRRTREAYRSRAESDPCWGVQAFSAYYPEKHLAGETAAVTAAIDEAQRWLTTIQGDCRRSSAPKSNPFGDGIGAFGPLDFGAVNVVSDLEADHVPDLQHMRFVVFTSTNPDIAVMVMSPDPVDRMHAQIRSGKLEKCRVFSDAEKAKVAADIARRLPTASAAYAQAKQAVQPADTLRERVQFLTLNQGYLAAGQTRSMYTCQLNL